MGRSLRAGQLVRDIDVAVFDKDGTLIEFKTLWYRVTERATTALCAALGTDSTVEAEIYNALGFNPRQGHCDADGALAVGPNLRIYDTVTESLICSGIKPTVAQAAVKRSFIPAFESAPEACDFRAAGDVRQLFQALQAAGIKVVVATTDLREPTCAALAVLSVSDFVDDLVCDDSPQRAVKPDPATLMEIAESFDTDVTRVMMVGDTVGDLRMARQAGCGLSVGVLTGAGTATELKAWSDVVVASIDDIQVD